MLPKPTRNHDLFFFFLKQGKYWILKTFFKLPQTVLKRIAASHLDLSQAHFETIGP